MRPLAYALLSDAPHCRRRILIRAAELGLADGAAHTRKLNPELPTDAYRAAPHDASVFVLQSDRAARRWPADDGAAGMPASCPRRRAERAARRWRRAAPHAPAARDASARHGAHRHATHAPGTAPMAGRMACRP